MRFKNEVEFMVYGDYALFSDPITRPGGEKGTLQIPTYEALKGVLHSIYWKPTIVWIVDEVRIMNQIQTESKGIRPIKVSGGNDLAYYTYLKNVCYQVRAHFEWNENRPELKFDRSENKHHNIAKRMIKKGGRRDIFLGTRECQAYVEPCEFGNGNSVYDNINEISFGLIYHGITYADEAYTEETKEKMSLRYFYPVMTKGIITFPHPKEFPNNKEGKILKISKDMKMKEFINKKNFSSIELEEEVEDELIE